MVMGKLLEKFNEGGNIDAEDQKQIEFRKAGFKNPVVSFENFHLGTFANFKKISTKEISNREPDFISKNRSKYWYVNNSVIRQSDHWGRTIATCNWLLDSASKKGLYEGICELKNFHRKMDNLLRDKNNIGKTFTVGKTVLIRNGGGKIDIDEMTGVFKKETSSFYVFDTFKVAIQTLAYVKEK